MAFFYEKRYSSADDRLFLSYYALPASIKNKNGWSIDPETLDKNIKSFIGRPIVVKRKDPNNPLDARQAGSFCHPMLGERSASLSERLAYNENFAIGRILDVPFNPDKGYRFEVEITDPLAKSVLKNPDYADMYPPYVSPQILTFGQQYPQEDAAQHFKHWVGSHLALVDMPAFGFDHASATGRCYGSQEDCAIKIHNASETETLCNFCIADAMKELIGVTKTHSSDINQNNNSLQYNMASSTTSTPAGTSATGVTQSLTTNPATGNKDFTINIPDNNSQVPNTGQNPQKTHASESEPESQRLEHKPGQETQEGEDQKASLPKTYEEAIQHIKGLTSTLSELKEQQAKTNKFIADLQKKDRINTLKTLIPREVFKSEDKYNEELERVYNWKGMEDAEIKEHFQGRMLAQVTSAKGASELLINNNKNNNNNNKDKYAHMQTVPEYHQAGEESTNNRNLSSSNFMKHYKLVNKIGGVDIE